MKNLLVKALSRPHRAPAMAAAAAQLHPLRAHPNATVRALIEASWQALMGQYSVEDAAAVAAVEAVRQRALRCQDKLTIEDYGAGSPDATLTADQMAQGRVIHRTVAQACQMASKRPFEAALLWHLIRTWRPRKCIELGCCVGISASYQARALHLNGDGGQLWTLEGAPAFAEVATRHFAEQGLSNVAAVVGRFQDTLDGVLHTQGPIDYAFIDGHHDEAATLRYCDQILPRCASRAVLVFDDIAWSKGMRRAWRHLAADPRFAVTIDCGEIGVCATDPDVTHPVRLRAVLG